MLHTCACWTFGACKSLGVLLLLCVLAKSCSWVMAWLWGVLPPYSHVLWHAGVQQAGDADRQNKHMMHVRQRGKHMHVMAICTADLPSEVENWYAHSVLR